MEITLRRKLNLVSWQYYTRQKPSQMRNWNLQHDRTCTLGYDGLYTEGYWNKYQPSTVLLMEHDDISFTFKMIHVQFSTLTIILEGISLTVDFGWASHLGGMHLLHLIKITSNVTILSWWHYLPPYYQVTTYPVQTCSLLDPSLLHRWQLQLNTSK